MLRRGLLRLWLAVSAIWTAALSVFILVAGIHSWTTAVGFLMLLAFWPSITILLLGKLALWVASGFSENPALRSTLYERSVSNLTLFFAVLSGGFGLYSYGTQTEWSLSWTSMAAYSLGAALSGALLGFLIGLIAYRKRSRPHTASRVPGSPAK